MAARCVKGTALPCKRVCIKTDMFREKNSKEMKNGRRENRTRRANGGEERERERRERERGGRGERSQCVK